MDTGLNKEIFLGKKITFSKKMIRVESRYAKQKGFEKLWKLKSIDATEGIIIGKRTFSNGINLYDDDGMYYKPTEHFQALIVAYDINRIPVVVPMEELQ